MENPRSEPHDEITSRSAIVQDLKALGVCPGDHLGLGVSLKSVGRLAQGPDTLIDALLEAVGDAGTLMIPTYTSMESVWKLRLGLRRTTVFAPGTTPAYTGAVAEAMRARPQAVRSRHPTNSVTAIGARADFLTRCHDERASAYSPYSRLAEIGGKMLCIGIGDRMVGMRHEAQSLAGLLDAVPIRRGAFYRTRDGSVRLFIRRDVGGCVETLPDLVKELRRQGLIQDGRVGLAKVTLCEARPALQGMADMLREDPTRNLCKKMSCLWCRELERRWGLYGRVEEPRYFQKSRVAVGLLRVFNRMRL